MRNKITPINLLILLLSHSFVILAFCGSFAAAAILDRSNTPHPKQSVPENKSKKVSPLTDAVSDKILVKFKTSTTTAEIKSILNGVGAVVIKYFDRIDVFHLKLGKGVSVNEAIKTLQQNPAVEYAESDQIYHINNI